MPDAAAVPLAAMPAKPHQINSRLSKELYDRIEAFRARLSAQSRVEIPLSEIIRRLIEDGLEAAEAHESGKRKR